MLEPSELGQLLLAIYEAAGSREVDAFQDAALALVQARLPFDSCTWGVASIGAEGMTVHSAHFFREVPNRYLTYPEVRSEDTVAFEASARPGRTFNYHLPTLFAAPRKAGMREYARRVRHQNELVMAQPRCAEGRMKWIALYRADSAAQFSEEQRAWCDVLLPHLMQALEMNRQLHLMSEASAEKPRQFFVAIADRSGFLHQMEPPCADLLRREWPSRPLAHAAAPLAEALAQPEAPGFRGRTLVVRFRRLGELVILKMRERRAIDSLTARELEVARHIAAGRSHKEIARALGIAPATVRNHTQRIHERLEAHSNAEIAAQLEAAGGSFAD